MVFVLWDVWGWLRTRPYPPTPTIFGLYQNLWQVVQSPHLVSYIQFGVCSQGRPTLRLLQCVALWCVLIILFDPKLLVYLLNVHNPVATLV